MSKLPRFSLFAAAVRQRLRFRLAAPLLAAGLVAGYVGPAPRTAPAAAAADDGRPPIRLGEPSLSPNGTTILVAFRYANWPYKLAVLSADPSEQRIRILEAPPTMSWTAPAWAPDQRHFAAISYCEGENCYEGAEGYHVWRFTVRPGPNNLERVTFDEGNARRDKPFFGRSADDLYWVFSSSRVFEGMRYDFHDRFLARERGGQGEVLLPDDAKILPQIRSTPGTVRPGPVPRSAKFRLIGLSPARAFNGTDLYFVGKSGRGTLPAAEASARGKLRYEYALFRWRGGDDVEILRDTPVQAVDAQRSGNGYVTVSREVPWGARPSDFHVMRDGRAELRLRFESGFAYSVSASERLDTLVFIGERSHWGERAIWVHREGIPQAVDLDVTERLRREVEFQIQREANGAADGREPSRATPAPPRPAAAPR